MHLNPRLRRFIGVRTMQVETKTDRSAWHVVHTKPRQEFRALQHLENQSYVCFLPTIKAEKAVRGKFGTHTEPLFSRYLFIKINPATCRMMPISSTRGVNKLVSFGARFATVPENMIEALQRMPPAVHQSLIAGDHVVVTDGPLAGFEGIYQIRNGEERAIVLIDFLSRPQNLSIKLKLLQKAR